MNQLYNLHQTFRSAQQILNTNHFFKVYKEFESEIELFRKALNDFQEDLSLYNTFIKDSSILSGMGVKDYFEIDIRTGFSEDSYQVLWNVDKVKEFIVKEKFKKIDIPVHFEQIHSKEDHLEDKKLIRLKSLGSFIEPIILAHIPVIDKFIVIDGSHRYHIAKRENHLSIQAVVLPLSIHIDFVLFDSSKLCLKIHHNINLLLFLCMSPNKPTNRINKNLGIYDYYPITENKLRFSSVKKHLLSLRQKLSI